MAQALFDLALLSLEKKQWFVIVLQENSGHRGTVFRSEKIVEKGLL